MSLHPLKSCRDIQALIFASQDRRLVWHERMFKTLHLKICTSCTQVERNVLTLNEGLSKWRNYTSKGE